MRHLVFALVLTSGSALACPDLSGAYLCRSETSSEVYDLEISQTTQRNVTTYTISSTDAETHERTTEVLKADGRPVILTEVDPDSGTTIKQTTMVTCTRQVLTVKIIVTVQNQVVGNLTSSVKKENNKIIQTINGKVGDNTINDSIICE